MKIVKLFLLLCLGVWASFKLDIPKSIDVTQLEAIVKNGWNEDNKTLNNLIVSTAERVMPEIKKYINKPILDNTWNILVTRDDYMFILAYIKYLEFEKKHNIALKMYQSILNGLNHIQTDNMIDVIYHVYIERLTIKALRVSMKNDIYTAHEIKTIIKPVLMLDCSLILNAFQTEANMSGQMLNRGLSLKLTSLEKNNLNEISRKLKKLHENFYTECYRINTHKSYEIFSEKYKKEQSKFLDNHIQEIAKFQVLTWKYIGSEFAKFWDNGKGNSVKDKRFVEDIGSSMHLEQQDVNSTLGAKWLFYSSSNANMCGRYKMEIIEEVQNNQNFLSEL